MTVIVTSMMAGVSSAKAANVARTWGLNNFGQLGIGTSSGPETCSGSSASESQEPCSTAPVQVSGLSGVSAMAGGGGGGATGQSLALMEDGTVMAWGEGDQGQLGDGKTESSDLPVAVSGLSGVKAIAAGGQSSMALLSGGTLEEWGRLAGGGSSDVPVEVAGLSGVTAIAAGGEKSLAVVSGGRVEAWGEGVLGNGTSSGSTTPVLVCAVGTVGTCPEGPYLEGVIAVAAGYKHNLALLGNGKVVAWGANTEGQLGDGTTEASAVPVPVSGLSGVTAIAAGNVSAGNGFAPFSLALLGDGTVRAWGGNSEGQLGDGSHTGPELCGETSPCSKTPVAVVGLSGVSAIAAHGKHALALLGNGAVMTWGSNEFGTLGIGTSAGPEPCGFLTEGNCSTKPLAVNLANAVIKGIAAGDYTSLAFGSPSAPAGLPEAGRCAKVPVGKGKYSNASCTLLATSETSRKYEWTPASPTEKLTFSGSGLETTLTTASHATITCVAANISGEWTAPKTASVSVELQGCTSPSGAQCTTVTNPNNKSEIKLNGVKGELGFIRYEEVEGKLIIVPGLDLEPQPPMRELAAYECTGSSEVGHLEGSVIGKIKPFDKMTTESDLVYYATKTGEQKPESFQATPKDTLTTTFTSGTETLASDASTLSIKSETGKSAVPLEIKAKL